MNYLQLYISLGLQMGYVAKFTNRLGIVDVGQLGIGHNWIGRFFTQCKGLLTSVNVKFDVLSIHYEVKPNEPSYFGVSELLRLKRRSTSLLPGTTA